MAHPPPARRVAVVLLTGVLAGMLGASSACMSRDDAQRAVEAIQPGGPPDVYPALQNPELPFRYPPGLYDQRVQANVTLRLHIDSLGRVLPESTQVAEPSGHRQLDSAAMSGARELRFTPARRDGRPIAVTALFPIYFRHPEAAPLPGDSVLGSGTGNREPATVPPP